MHAENR
jgi:hypothetical protein